MNGIIVSISIFDIAFIGVAVVFIVLFAARFVSAFREASRREKENRRNKED